MTGTTNKQEFTLNQFPVELATKETPPGVVDQIEQRALAQATDVELNISKAEQVQNQGSDSAAEAKLGGEILMQAVGLGGVGAVAEFFDTRRMDKSQGRAPQTSSKGNGAEETPVRHIDDDMKSMMRAPAGIHRASPKENIFGSTQVADKFIPKSKGGDIFAAAQIAGDTLKKQPAGATSTWKEIPQAKKAMPAVNDVQAVFANRIASQAALDSVKVTREHHAALAGHLQRSAPGLGMGGANHLMNLNLSLMNGPRPPDSSILQDAQDSSSSSSWSGA